MTNAAQTTSTAAAAEAPRANWPQRFGALKSLEVKSGRKGSYGIITLQCGKFEQTAFIFNDKVLKKAQAKLLATKTVVNSVSLPLLPTTKAWKKQN